jgi:hypothetical protein
MLTPTQMRETATNLRKMASDPQLKKMFPSVTRKSFNDDANAIMAALHNSLSEDFTLSDYTVE